MLNKFKHQRRLKMAKLPILTKLQILYELIQLNKKFVKIRKKR